MNLFYSFRARSDNNFVIFDLLFFFTYTHNLKVMISKRLKNIDGLLNTYKLLGRNHICVFSCALPTAIHRSDK